MVSDLFPNFDPELYKLAEQEVIQNEPRIRKEARKLSEFKQYKSRNFRDVKDYPKWDSICEALSVELLGIFVSHNALLQIDWVKNVTLPNYYWGAYKKAKAWWLGRELAEAFLQSEIKDNVLDLRRTTRHGMIVLPSQFLYTPDGEEVMFISFSHWEEGETAPPISERSIKVEFKPCEFNQIILCTSTIEGTSYASSIGLRKVGDSPLDRGQWQENALLSPQRKKEREIEAEFLRKLDNLVLQSLLIIQAYPEYVEVPAKPLKGVANTKKVGKGSGFNEPTWIGKNFRYKRTSTPTGTKQSRGAAVDRAPRIGFWRFLDSDKGWYKETRWVWNQPERREDSPSLKDLTEVEKEDSSHD